MGNRKAKRVVEEVDLDEEIILDGDISDADIEAAAAEAEARDGAYEDQPAEEAPPERKAKASAPKAARTVLPAGTLPSVLITSKVGTDPKDYILNVGDKPDAAQMTALLEKIDSLGKKPREKCVNTFHSLNVGKAPSGYIIKALNALSKAPEGMSQADLVAVYETKHGYKPGTARAQAGQMFQVLPVLGLATKAEGRGTPLVLNANSALLLKLAALGE